MKSVWLVEQGEYSDYNIVGVYSTKEKAKMCAKRYNKEFKAFYYKEARARVCERTCDPIWDKDKMYPES